MAGKIEKKKVTKFFSNCLWNLSLSRYGKKYVWKLDIKQRLFCRATHISPSEQGRGELKFKVSRKAKNFEFQTSM